jgi:hypothetical protein
LSTIAARASAQTVSFIARRDFVVGLYGPTSVAVGDFNKDGLPDLAVADGSGFVSVLLGNGDGTFQAATDFGVGLAPGSVAVGDFNGDGILDLAVTHLQYPNGGVSVLLGRGDGTFLPAQNFAAGIDPVFVAVGDFNGDGKPDLAVANGGFFACCLDRRSVSVLLGNGDGTFQAARIVFFDQGATSVAVGDFNGDGKLDLAVTISPPSGPGNVLVLLGNGDGTFQAAQRFAAGSTPASVHVADFNGDRIEDLVVVNGGSNSASVLLGNGDGTFRAAQSFAAGSYAGSVAVGDFNGDGTVDLAVTNGGSNSVSVLLGNGDGTFRAPKSFATGPNPASVAVSDFNGDGKLDLATVDPGSSPLPLDRVSNISVLLGKGDGTFLGAATFAAGSGPESAAVGDFNRDGFKDLVVTNASSNTISVLLGNGNGTFLGPQSFAAGTHPGSVAVGDFNGDGKLDLVVANSGTNTVSVLLGNGDGTFVGARGFDAGSTPVSVHVGDFNGDRITDLVVANAGSSNTVSVLLGNGDGTFQPPRNVPAGGDPGSVVAGVTVGDFNGDGIQDLAVANRAPFPPPACPNVESGNVSILFGNGDGTFRTGQVIPIRNPTAMVVGDFNGDGFQDLAVSEQDYYYCLEYLDCTGLQCDCNFATGHTVSILLGTGQGTFAAPRNISVGEVPSELVVGDFNGDGKLDLAVANRDSNISVLLGNGDGTFLAAQNFGAGCGPGSVAVDDFNGDGKPDLAVANRCSDNVSVLINNTPTRTTTAPGAGDR